MEAKIKTLEVELSEESQKLQDKEQEVGQLSTVIYLSYKMWANKDEWLIEINALTIVQSYADDSIEPY